MTGPGTTPDYRGVRLKLKRANIHVNALGRELRRLKQPPTIMSPGRDGWMTVRYTGKTPPLRLGLLAGDFAHNARSALDHLVWQLAIKNRTKPERHNVFPVYVTEDEWRNAIEQRPLSEGPSPIDGLSEDARRAIRDCQPFALASRRKDAVKTALFQLHRLSLIDKHRTLHVATVRMSDSEARLVGVGPVIGMDIKWFVQPNQEVKPGQRIFRWRPLVPAGMEDVPVVGNFQIPLTIGFDLGKDDGGMIRIRRMREILSEVTGIIENLMSLVG